MGALLDSPLLNPQGITGVMLCYDKLKYQTFKTVQLSSVISFHLFSQTIHIINYTYEL